MDSQFVFLQKAFIVNSSWQALVYRPLASTDPSPVWDLPGGILGAKESLRSSLAWHVSHQTGLSLSIISHPLHITTYLDWLDRSRQIVRSIYLCHAEGELANTSNYEFQWVDNIGSTKIHFPDEGYHLAFANLNVHSQTAAVDFLGAGMLSESVKYLESAPPSVNI